MRKLKRQAPPSEPNVPVEAESTADLDDFLGETFSPPPAKPMPEAMGRIVETEFEGPDLVEEKRDLEALLDSSGKPGHQIEALEHAEVNSRRAFRVLIRFREMHAAWKADNDVVFGAMWAEATRMLQAEKDAGKRNKTIAEADVRLTCATTFPDEWREQETRRLRAAQTEKSLENLVEAWASRCRSLRSLVDRGRG